MSTPPFDLRATPYARRRLRQLMRTTGLFGACIALLLSTGAGAQENEKTPKVPKIFSSDEVLSITIDGPWKTVARLKERDDSWPGTVTTKDHEGNTVNIPVQISTRGLTRLKVCDFPPLRLDFDEEAAKGTAFRKAGNLKLVTHCLANRKYEQYTIKEYLSYKIYNKATPLSFRVQGLDVSYQDSARGSKPIERFAFLIEDPDDVAKRNDLKKLDIEEVSPKRLDDMETARFMMFQYLISNLDWSALSGPKVRCCHNARLIGESFEAPKVYVVPYDLDSSGLVNTHYAAPPAGVQARNVRQRIYRGFCRHNAEIPAVLEEFRELRPQWIALFEDEPRLDGRNRGTAIKFLNSFYSSLEDEDDVQKRITGNCRG